MARSKLNTSDTVWASVPPLTTEERLHPSAAADIADRIQQLIIAEGLAEGERLPSERDLAGILATSRPTVSQAIRILITRGLIESRRGSGAYVTNSPLSSIESSVRLMLDLRQESVVQLNELRLWLETTGVLAAIDRATEDDLKGGQRALRDLVSDAGDTAAWMSADTRFHTTLVRASKNPFLSSLYESVHGAVINYEYRSWIDNGTVPAWLRESNAEYLRSVHEPILEAVRIRDREAARAAVLRHHEAMAQHLAQSESIHSGDDRVLDPLLSVPEERRSAID